MGTSLACIAPRCADQRQPGSLFCRAHEAAPPAQRGGWLSAHRRSQRRGGTAVDQPVLDASNIARRLWVGAAPPVDRSMPEFDLLVMCAREVQPSEIAFRGTVLRCPLNDAVLAPRELSHALMTGRSVAGALQRGRRVLVTCAAGRNRSALVAGLALGIATTMPPQEIVSLIRQRRSPDCLSNPYFVDVMMRYLRRRPTAAAADQ